jgi:hypothetical protein
MVKSSKKIKNFHMVNIKLIEAPLVSHVSPQTHLWVSGEHKTLDLLLILWLHSPTNGCYLHASSRLNMDLASRPPASCQGCYIPAALLIEARAGQRVASISCLFICSSTIQNVLGVVASGAT